jgi:peptidoglycan/xylan/chitin deacetylase (PgdA/CDA1 family)
MPRFSVRATSLLAVLLAAAPAHASVALTFDDGYQSAWDVARPVLQQRGLPATFFIISGRLGGKHLTPLELRALAADGFEIGSHTVDHRRLTRLPADVAEVEMTQSKAELEAIIGEPVVDLAYPYGDYDAAVEARCLAIYLTCRAFGPGAVNVPGFDRGAVRAFGVDANVSARQVRAWMELGRAPDTLVVLVYHQLGDPPKAPYGHSARSYASEMQYLSASGIPVVCMRDVAVSGGTSARRG